MTAWANCLNTRSMYVLCRGQKPSRKPMWPPWHVMRSATLGFCFAASTGMADAKQTHKHKTSAYFSTSKFKSFLWKTAPKHKNCTIQFSKSRSVIRIRNPSEILSCSYTTRYLIVRPPLLLQLFCNSHKNDPWSIKRTSQVVPGPLHVHWLTIGGRSGAHRERGRRRHRQRSSRASAPAPTSACAPGWLRGSSHR